MSDASTETSTGTSTETGPATPIRTEAGPLAFTIDWHSISWLWDMNGYPAWPGYLDFHRLSMGGLRIFRIDGRLAVPR